MGKGKEMELYFHIPFCIRKCLYCDFLSAPGKPGEIGKYMEALCREVRKVSADSSERLKERLVTGIFIGGGTPSLLSGEQIKELMDTVRECFSLADAAEITMEANPGTVDLEKLLGYRAAGVNRLSIGLQSAKDNELKALGRIHSYADFLETFENARRAGFSNINVDVMSALPGQTLQSYVDTLKRVLELGPEHISAYSLIVEEGTPFREMDRAGRLDLPDEDTERKMYYETDRMLRENGYFRYEISNYAKAGFACRHNCGYWERTDYLGFGIGAASLLENVRFHNGRSLDEYLRAPDRCRQEVHVLSKEEQMEEFMFLGLRMTQGISPEDFREQFGVSLYEIYGPVIERNMADGLLCFRKDGGAGEDRLALTEKGLDLSNYCMAQFLFS